ncbi:MAG: AsmA family protein [Bacteroidetes bacterium]|nr:AsmA family protein [Bacteroidota bacterium]
MFRKVMRWLLWSFIGVLSMLFIIAVVSLTYVFLNQDRIVKSITASIGKEINGEISNQDVSFDLIQFFPATAIHLKEFSARDSMYAKHKMELLHAKDVFVRVNFKDLFSSKIDIEHITLENGNIYLFTDSTGYSNKYLFTENSKSNTGTFQTKLTRLVFKNFKVIYRDQIKNKFFNIYFNQLKCNFFIEKSLKKVDLASIGKIKFLGFNVYKGFYGISTPFETTISFFIFFSK